MLSYSCMDSHGNSMAVYIHLQSEIIQFRPLAAVTVHCCAMVAKNNNFSHKLANCTLKFWSTVISLEIGFFILNEIGKCYSKILRRKVYRPFFRKKKENKMSFFSTNVVRENKI